MNQEDILYIHHRLIEDYGGVHGVRDIHRLKSAIHKLATHPDTVEAAAYFVRDVIQYHPFVDGNKRTAVTIMGIYLSKNSLSLSCTTKELENFAIMVATTKCGLQDITKWIQTNTTRTTNY